MSSEPTREELLAQVAALQAELQARAAPAPNARIAVARDLVRQRTGKSTPDEIVAQIAGLKSVISSGVNSAGYGDKRTEFRSLNELREILNGLEEDLDELSGAGGRVRQIRMTTQADKGL